MPPPHHPKRSILITGCSNGGLGAALAEAFHETGRWRVIASARDLTKLQGLRGLKNGQEEDGIEQVQLDVVDEASVRAAVVAVQKLLADGGDGRRNGEVVGLDAICLNAGGGYSVGASPCSVSPLLSAISYSYLVDAPAPTLTHLTPTDATDRHPAILTSTSRGFQPQRLLPA
jgi:NAD(P)-dependent dehydrogenase (short-subunit alcohol dehydrogenase family)